jgi:hypothetical protein
MNRTEEWDFWPERPRTRRQRFYRTIEYQPSGWNSPVTRKIVDIFWRTIVTAVKMVVAVPLALMLVGSIWLLWTIIALVV